MQFRKRNGVWGIRGANLREGETVQVMRRDGRERTVTLGKVTGDWAEIAPDQLKRNQTIDPTPEQQAVIDLVSSGKSGTVQAYAGTGKTTVLRLAAEANKTKRFRYVAFNKNIVDDAKRKMPENVDVSTAHSLAFGYTDQVFRDRLKTKDDKLSGPRGLLEIARRWQVQPTDDYRPAQLVAMAIRALSEFCKSADEEPTGDHIEGDEELKACVLPLLRRAWTDVINKEGFLPYQHAYYLKSFALTHTILPVDGLMVDEAQDLSPVLLSIVKDQVRAGKQVILVGDDYQAINGFTGAVNAMQAIKLETTVYLTKSWRFGEGQAALANRILDDLGAPKPLVGNGDQADSVMALEHPTAVLTRSNAEAVTYLLREIAAGGKPKLIGNDREIRAFCEAAIDLQASRTSTLLPWADSWADVQDYARDEETWEYRLMVEIVDEFGPHAILGAVRNMPEREQDATLIVSTAHKVKGREWESVKLSAKLGVLREGQISRDELMLLYVAVTRGRKAVDVQAVPYFSSQS